VEIGEPDRFPVETIEVWGLKDGVSVAAELPVALVIGEDDEDIWRVSEGSLGWSGWGSAEGGTDGGGEEANPNEQSVKPRSDAVFVGWNGVGHWKWGGDSAGAFISGDAR
jgi:hypothetical protein